MAARWVNATDLECEAPALAPGVVAVEVSVNGLDFTADGETVAYAGPRGSRDAATPPRLL